MSHLKTNTNNITDNTSSNYKVFKIDDPIEAQNIAKMANWCFTDNAEKWEYYYKTKRAKIFIIYNLIVDPNEKMYNEEWNNYSK